MPKRPQHTKKYTLKNTCNPEPSFVIDYKKELNPQQFEVVTKADGPCLVLAGAGSGKTRTLIYRVAYLIEKGIPAKDILLVTFTNKAAREMQNRIEVLLKSNHKGAWWGTFHHIGHRSIRTYAKDLNLHADFGILDEEDSRSLIKTCIRGLKIDSKEYRFPKPSVVHTIISFVRNSKYKIKDVVESRYPYFINMSGQIENIAALYERRKHESNVLDYDDLLIEWIRLLNEVPHARERFQDQFKYILVDEYQDTNKLQFDIIKTLYKKHNNILVVGDDAQSIYSFRSAEIRNILDFPKQFPGTKIFKLETNYRSTPQILDLANESINNNDEQFPKKLVSIKKDGQLPALVPLRDLHSQASFAAQRILELHDEGVALNNIAVLFRAHYQSAELEMAFIKSGIPYIIRGGQRFFEQAHIKDILAYLKIMQNPSDELSWIRALSLYPGISTGYGEEIFNDFKSHYCKFEYLFQKDMEKNLPKRAREGFLSFRAALNNLLNDAEIKSHPDQLVETVLENGYDRYLRASFDNAQDRSDDIKELVNFAHTYKSLKEFLADITLRESFKGETILHTADSDEHVVLSTIHQAKGLEWHTVMVVGLIEGQFPHPKSLEDPAQLEEERRLFYVAATRAKEQLYLIHPMSRFDYNYGSVICRPSIFITELSDDVYERWETEEMAESGNQDYNF